MKSKIVFEDESLIVVHKPAGLATQTGRVGQQDLVSEVKNYLASDRKTAGEPYVGLVHRLDQPAEGLLVLAKNEWAAKELSAQIAKHKIEKCYYAVIYGHFSKTNDVLIDYLCKDSKTNTSRIADQNEKEAKRAELEYSIVTDLEQKLNMSSDAYLVRIKLKTGRHHQIRIQMAHAGLPLLGDAKYGTAESIQASALKDVKEVALCAYKLCFTHPLTNKEMMYQIEPEGKAFVPYIGKY